MIRKAAGLTAVLLFSCVKAGYPLSANGNVDVRMDVASALFAADGATEPESQRQTPDATGVTLFMTEEGDPAYGAQVRVHVEPQEALTLASDPAEGDTPSCTITDGAFQCMATEEGFARFIAASPSTWSGTAQLVFDWGAAQPKQVPLTILPAGLPPTAQNFALVVSDLATDGHVTADYSQVVCSVSPTPAMAQSEWKHIRIKEARVRASAPPDSPTSLTNAPVHVSALAADVRLSLKDDCVDREPALDIDLAEDGVSPSFYLCFSDVGGQLGVTITSGATTATSTFNVDPEPHLLRVEPVNPQAPLSVMAGDVPAFDVAAYGADLEQRIALPVHLTLSGTAEAKLDRSAFTLVGDNFQPPDQVTLTPLTTGGLVLHVTPGVFSSPDCASAAIHVDP